MANTAHCSVVNWIDKNLGVEVDFKTAQCYGLTILNKQKLALLVS